MAVFALLIAASIGLLATPAQALELGTIDPWQRDAMRRLLDAPNERLPGGAWPLAEETEQAFFAEGSLAAAAHPSKASAFGFGQHPRAAIEAGGRIHAADTGWGIDVAWHTLRHPEHGRSPLWDGTAIVFGTDKAFLYAGWVDQWWGPGWEGSLLLSNAARARPTLGGVLRGTNKLLGGWDLRAFVARLDGMQSVARPLHFGLRLGWRPIPRVEFGFERVAQICGQNRPCGLKSFGKMLLGLDNAGQAGITKANQPGNQLGGMSMRLRLGRQWAAYAQGAGEDEAGKLPSKWFWLLGAERWGAFWRVFVEYADLRVGAFYRRPELGTVYAHGVYRDGYRNWARPLGHAVDGDGRLWSIGAIGSVPDFSWRTVLRRAIRMPTPQAGFVHETSLEVAIKHPIATNITLAFSGAWVRSSVASSWAVLGITSRLSSSSP